MGYSQSAVKFINKEGEKAFMWSKNILKALKISKNKFLKKLSEEEILSSREMQELLTAIAQTVSGHYGKETEVQLLKLPNKQTIAYMNKNTIVVNYINELLDFFGTIEKKIMCMVGLVVHEASHKRYLNLNRLEKINKMRLKGKWPTSIPNADPYLLDEIEDFINDESNKGAVGKIFAKMAWAINNILADVHDENAVSAEFPGTPAKSLAYPQVAMYELVPIFEDEIKKIMNESERLSFIFSLILRYARFHDVKIDTEDCWENEFVLKLVECMDHIEDGIGEDNIDKRQESVNELLVLCWPFIKDAIDEMKKDSSDGGEGAESEDDSPSEGTETKEGDSSSKSREISEEALKKLLEELERSTKETKSTTPTEMPVLPEPKAKPKTSKEDGESKKDEDSKSKEEKLKEPLESASKVEESDDLAKRTMEKLCEEIAERKAMEKAEKERSVEVSAEAKDVEKGALHSHITVSTQRKIYVDKDMIEEYNREVKDLLPTSKALQRQVRNSLQKREPGGRSYGEIYGNHFEGSTVYNKDGKWFARDEDPTEPQTLCVGILVDESGSMCGNRVIAARKMAVICEDFTRNLGIPTLICGHSTNGGKVFELYSYIEFNQIDKKDRYRLMDIQARSQNRDGLALKIMCERMMKRNENAKLLIVISDGEPCDYDYGGPSAEMEMKEVCKTYRKKGLTIFGAAIGSDKENIKRIYGDGFLDLSDLETLPKAMVQLIKKHIKY